MTDQKRARVAEIIGQHLHERVWCDICSSEDYECGCDPDVWSVRVAKAAERIDAIYSEGGEPVKMLVAYHNHEIVHLHDWDAEDAEKIAAIANVTPLYASPPSESDGMAEAAEQFRKGYEEGERYTESLRNQLDTARATRAHDKLKIEAQSAEIARLRKALEEVLAAAGDALDAFRETREPVASALAVSDMHEALTRARRALSDTPESNDNQGGMDDG